MELQSSRKADYTKALKRVLDMKAETRCSSDWVRHQLVDGDVVYLDLKNHNHLWKKPPNFDQLKSAYISAAEVEWSVNEMNNVKSGEMAVAKNIVRLQVRWRPLASGLFSFSSLVSAFFNFPHQYTGFFH